MSKNKALRFGMNRFISRITNREIQKLKLNPRPYQKKLIDTFDEGVKFLMICWCRRLGKDILAMYLTCRLCVNEPNQIVYYVFNTMKQGKMMILDAMTTEGKRLITEIVDESVLDKPRSGNLYHTDNTLRFKNGSRIYFVDAQDADTKVGGNLNLLVLSELATYRRQDILEYLIPSTLKVGGRIIAVSTPRYGSKFNDMMLEENENRYKSIISATSPEAIDNEGNPIYTQEELEYAMTQMSKEKYLQEYECDLTTANATSIYSMSLESAHYEKDVNVIGKRVYVSFDLGFNDGQSLVFSYIENGKAKPFHWYYTNNQPTKHYVDYINNIMSIYSIGMNQIELILPHDGRNRQDGYTQLISREQMYRNAGFKVNIVPAMNQLQGIEITRASIVQGDITFINNPIVVNMINQLKKYEWKTTNGVVEYIPIHGKGLSSSNIADSLEYLAIFLFRNKYVENVYKGFTGARKASTIKGWG